MHWITIHIDSQNNKLDETLMVWNYETIRKRDPTTYKQGVLKGKNRNANEAKTHNKMSGE